MDPSFIESLPEAHPIEAARSGATSVASVATEVVLKEFFKSVSEAAGPFSIAVAAGVAYNQLVGIDPVGLEA